MTNMFRAPRTHSNKTTYLLSAIMISILMFAYQNCGKVNTNPHDVDASMEQKPAVAALKDIESLSLLKTTDVMEINSYKVDIVTGEIERTLYDVPLNDPANKPVKLCLSEEKTAELQNAVENARICLFKAANKNQQCIMTYVYPYAIATQASDVFKLGENASSCSDFYDICTEDRDAFISVIKYVLSDIDSSICN